MIDEHREEFLQTEEVPRCLRRVRRLVEVGEFEQRCIHEDAEQQREGRDEQRGGELCGEQVRPDVDLVHRLGLDILDGAGFHDRQQTLGVTARAGGRRRGERGDTTAGTRGHRSCGTTATTTLLALLEQRARDRLAVVVAGTCGGRVVTATAALGVAAGRLAALQQVFWDLSHSSLSPGLERSGDAAVLADSPEVDGHEDHDHERQQQHVEDVPT